MFADLPFPVVVFTQRQNAEWMHAAGAEVDVVAVRWSDAEGVLRLAKEWRDKVGIGAVAVLDETLMEQGATLAEALQLSGEKPGTTERFRNKLLMKRTVQAAGVRVPEFTSALQRDAAQSLLTTHGRLVMKPVDGQGSVGVSFVDSPASLARWYAAHGDGHGYEAEQFIEGRFFHVNSLVHQGEALATFCAAYSDGNADIDFSRGAPLCSRMLEPGPLTQRLSRLCADVTRALGLRQGVTHLECFLTAEDELVFCEIAGRPGGGVVPWLIEAQSGVNPLRACVQLSAGMPPPSPRPDEGGPRAGVIGFRAGAGTGIVKQMPTAADFAAPWLCHVQMLRQPGDLITPAAHSADYLGQIVFWSDDLPEFQSRCAQLHGQFECALGVSPL